MGSNVRKIIKETIEESLLICEIKIDIQDTKKRGFADQLGKMYQESLKKLKPVKIIGKLNVSGLGSDNASVFTITLSNGDVINALRNTNPAYGNISINGEKEYFIKSDELFNNKLPDLIKKYYLEYKTAKAGIPSI